RNKDTAAAPIVNAWVVPEGLHPVKRSLKRIGTRDFERPDPVRIGGHECKVESPAFETHWLRPPEGDEPRAEPCLVVRMDYEPEPKVRLRMGGAATALHRCNSCEAGHYEGAPKSSAIFWAIDDSGRIGEPPLQFISLDEVK